MSPERIGGILHGDPLLIPGTRTASWLVLIKNNPKTTQKTPMCFVSCNSWKTRYGKDHICILVLPLLSVVVSTGGRVVL